LYPDAVGASLESELSTISAGHEFAGVWRGRRKDGSIVWVEARTTLMRDAAGGPLGFLGIAKDVTDRVLAEEARARADADRQRALELAEAASGVVRAAPWTDFSDAAGVRHRLWPVVDGGLQKKLVAELALVRQEG
ncbi:MAG: PAS domain S-box protein, partial [Gemmatimonadaceae bacterium]